MRVGELLKDRVEWLTPASISEQTPLVSVLLPTWHRAKSGLFEAAVKSVLNQTMEDLELIIVDDCSTDGTFDIIQKQMEEDNRVKCIHHLDNIGLPAVSEFEAYEKSCGEYIAFIFDDNEWELDGLERLVNYAKEHNSMAVVGQYMLYNGVIDGDYDDLDQYITFGGSQVQPDNLYISNLFANGSVLLNRKVIQKVGLYDPNVVLTRVCDWDLWLRIHQEFKIDFVDILVGREKGYGLNDSLGNTLSYHFWAAQERMRQPRNNELTVENYRNVEIFDTTVESSPLLYYSIVSQAKQYQTKAWFCSDDAGLQAVHQKSKKKWQGMRIAYLCDSGDMTASATLYWTRLPYNEYYTICYSNVLSYDFANWIYADAIVIERNTTPEIDPVLHWADKMGLPCYYYIDDNYRCITDDSSIAQNDAGIMLRAECTNKERLSKLSGLFCSSQALIDYFGRQEHFHDRIALFPPILDKKICRAYQPIEDLIRLVFFGGSFRTKVFGDIIFQAIEELSHEHAFVIYFPDNDLKKFAEMYPKKGKMICGEDGKAEFFINKNLKFVSFKRTLCLNDGLRSLQNKNVQIQIHCSPEIANNRYKTQNALLNAVTLGAVLITSDTAPYSELAQRPERVCYLAKNTVQEWKHVIYEAIHEKNLEQVYQNALRYCEKEFKSSIAQQSLSFMFQGINSASIEDQYEKLVKHNQYFSLNMKPKSNGNFPVSAQSVEVIHAVQESTASLMAMSMMSSRQIWAMLGRFSPNWHRSLRGYEKFFPLTFTRLVSHGEFLPARLKKQTACSIFIVPSGRMNVLLEFVINRQIVSRKTLYVDAMGWYSFDVPESDEVVYVHIANMSASMNMSIVCWKVGLKRKIVVS